MLTSRIFLAVLAQAAAMSAASYGAAAATDTQATLESVVTFGENQLNAYKATGPRMPVSWVGSAGMDDLSYTYDASLLLKFFLACGRFQDARAIGDALVALQKADPLADGRWRAGYYANSLYALDGSTAAIRDSDATVGNVAHAGDSLVRLYAATADQSYLQSAIHAADWINTHTRKDDAMGGYSVGSLGWGREPGNYRVLEHQAAVSVLSQSLLQVTGDSRWAEMHAHARAMIDRLYDAEGGHYWTGTAGEDGTDINYSPIPGDQVFVSLLGDEPTDRRSSVLAWVAANLHVTEVVGGRTYYGYRFSSGGTGLHTEASGFIVATRLLAGQPAEGMPELSSLEDIRLYAPNSDPEGIGLVAAIDAGGATTGYGVTYPNALHLGAAVAYGDALLTEAGDPNGNPFHATPEPATLLLLLACMPWVLRRVRSDAGYSAKF